MLAPALLPLVVTILIEVPIVALIFSRQRGRMALACLGATGVTNLLMNTLLRSSVSSYEQYILIGELGALTIEAAVYAVVSRPRDIPRALLASALANAASYAVGLFVFA